MNKHRGTKRSVRCAGRVWRQDLIEGQGPKAWTSENLSVAAVGDGGWIWFDNRAQGETESGPYRRRGIAMRAAIAAVRASREKSGGTTAPGGR